MIKDTVLSKIGEKIKAERKRRGMNLSELASLSNVTAGLVSKIENFRTIPSIPVLLNIARGLNVSLSDLVEDVEETKEVSYLKISKEDRQVEDRKDSSLLIYESLIHQELPGVSFRTNIVRVPPKAYREPIATDAMELIYVISGSVKYAFDDHHIYLKKDECLYFDGTHPHSVSNKNKSEAVLFKIYFFHPSNDK